MAKACRSEAGARVGVEGGVAEGRADMAECGGSVSIATIFFASLPSEKCAIAGWGSGGGRADFAGVGRSTKAAERFSEADGVLFGA